MKKDNKITFFIVIIFIIAVGLLICNNQNILGLKGICGPPIDSNHDLLYCDKSCDTKSDCKFTCGCGAINKNEICHDEGIIYDCEYPNVTCKSNRCTAP